MLVIIFISFIYSFISFPFPGARGLHVRLCQRLVLSRDFFSWSAWSRPGPGVQSRAGASQEERGRQRQTAERERGRGRERERADARWRRTSASSTALACRTCEVCGGSGDSGDSRYLLARGGGRRSKPGPGCETAWHAVDDTRGSTWLLPPVLGRPCRQVGTQLPNEPAFQGRPRSSRAVLRADAMIAEQRRAGRAGPKVSELMDGPRLGKFQIPVCECAGRPRAQGPGPRRPVRAGSRAQLITPGNGLCAGACYHLVSFGSL